MADRISAIRVQNGGFSCRLSFHARLESGGYGRVFGSAPVATQNENQAARYDQPTIGETISEPKIPMTFGMFSASTTDVPVIRALVKPIPMIAPIRVCELEAGRPKYRAEVPDNCRQQHGKDHGEAMC